MQISQWIFIHFVLCPHSSWGFHTFEEQSIFKQNWMKLSTLACYLVAQWCQNCWRCRQTKPGQRKDSTNANEDKANTNSLPAQDTVQLAEVHTLDQPVHVSASVSIVIHTNNILANIMIIQPFHEQDGITGVRSSLRNQLEPLKNKHSTILIYVTMSVNLGENKAFILLSEPDDGSIPVG